MRVWWQAIRPKTLLASIGPIILATSLAASDGFFNAVLFAVTIICALFLQISVNLANDLFDGLSGIDNAKRLGPARVLQTGMVSASALSMALKVTVSISIISGMYLVYQGGAVFFILGCLCILGVYTYSAGPFPLASNALGEVAVFLYFGLLAVLGSYFLQADEISVIAFLFAVIVGMHSSAIMLVNNIRDIETDAASGKNTLAVQLGETTSRYCYLALILGSIFIHLLGHSIISKSSVMTLFIPLVICGLFLPFLFNAGLRFTGSHLNKLLSATAVFGFIYASAASLTLLM